MAHILVIDDDEQFRAMLVQMLTQDGHQVTIAADGEEGLRLARKSAPELIITDILMPKKDGMDVMLELSRSHSRIPVIAVSGGRRCITAEFNLDSAALLGARAVLAKPFTRADLRQALATALP
jgi:CheY-like chemotaxis protein